MHALTVEGATGMDLLCDFMNAYIESLRTDWFMRNAHRKVMYPTVCHTQGFQTR